MKIRGEFLNAEGEKISQRTQKRKYQKKTKKQNMKISEYQHTYF